MVRQLTTTDERNRVTPCGNSVKSRTNPAGCLSVVDFPLLALSPPHANGPTALNRSVFYSAKWTLQLLLLLRRWATQLVESIQSIGCLLWSLRRSSPALFTITICAGNGEQGVVEVACVERSNDARLAVCHTKPNFGFYDLDGYSARLPPPCCEARPTAANFGLDCPWTARLPWSVPFDSSSRFSPGGLVIGWATSDK